MSEAKSLPDKCWNCGSWYVRMLFRHKEEDCQMFCGSCGVRGPRLPEQIPTVEAWNDIAETMALAEKARQEADHKIAEAAREAMHGCRSWRGDGCTGYMECHWSRLCNIVEAQNSPEKSLDTGKGEG